MTGKAQLQFTDGRFIRVIINARGLEPGGVHLGHIHGRVANGTAVDSQCPTMAADSDGDGFVEPAEGVPSYGDILIPLGNVDPDGDGRVNYHRTIDLTTTRYGDGANADQITPLDFRAIVLHGLTVPQGPGTGTTGEVDGTNGYLNVLPVACGEIAPVGRGR
ncbi:hypothetical protein [Croceicoccus hydrothermalis]|uniref:hypothetical protein n=1 Tax=Croceicoccus hydrothermalis TaxID=2867964 RepID=UPI001EFC1B6E|nr:hypothetical protein [Croceicoccus hydrothermalis]